MDYDKIKSFVEVYNCRSISKASENLFISPSALSRRIRALEEEFETELFIRKGTELEPTAGGKTFYKEAGKILRQHDLTLMKIKQYKKGVGGALRIGVLPSLKLSPTVRAVSIMHENYPDTELIFDCDKNTNIPYRMANRELDVGITVYGEVRGISEFQYETLSQNTLSVMLGRTHRLWNKRPLYVEDLDGEKACFIYSYLMYLEDRKTFQCQNDWADPPLKDVSPLFA